MSLAVIGHESISKLKEIVFEKFGALQRNNDIKAPTFKNVPFPKNDDFSGIFVKKTPIAPVDELHLIWQISPTSESSELYRSNPSSFVGSLIGDESTGSAIKAIKDARLGLSISAGISLEPYTTYALFEIDIKLTSLGVKNIDKVLSILFRYINILKNTSQHKQLWEEYKQLKLLNFRYAPPQNAQDIVTNLSRSLQIIEPVGKNGVNDTLQHPSRIVYNPTAIATLFDTLIPENAVIIVSSQSFPPAQLDKIEPIYGTMYSKAKISPTQIKLWNIDDTADLQPFTSKLAIPRANMYIPDATKLFDRVPVPSLETVIVTESDDFNGLKNHSFPKLLKQDLPTSYVESKLYWKKDETFLRPLVFLSCRFITKYTSAKMQALSQLLVSVIKDSLNEELYEASLAGFSFNLYVDSRGLVLNFSGYSDMIVLQRFIKVVTKSLGNISGVAEESHFDGIKEAHIKSIKSFDSKQPYQHALYYRGLALDAENSFTKEDLLVEIQNISFSEVIDSIKTIFANGNLRCFSYGNISEKESIELIKPIQSAIVSSGKRVSLPVLNQFSPNKEIKLNSGNTDILEVVSRSEDDVNSAALVTFQIGTRTNKSDLSSLSGDDSKDFESFKTTVLLEILTTFMSTPAFDQLRTKEQLGYIVFSFSRISRGVQSMNVLVQSSTKSAKILFQRIMVFLKTFRDNVNSLVSKGESSKEWNEYIETVLASYRKKDIAMSDTFDRFWREIDNETFEPIFDRVKKLCAIVNDLKPSDLFQFYNKFITKDSNDPNMIQQRRLFATLVYSKENQKDMGKDFEVSTTNILQESDVFSWTQSSNTFWEI